MTKKMITSYTALLCMAVAMGGVTAVNASEVTGTLSSDTASTLETSGNLNGTVSNGNSGGSNSGATRTNGRVNSSSSSNEPTGAVLGASSAQTPGFPNAGFAPAEVIDNETIWSVCIDLFGHFFSF